MKNLIAFVLALLMPHALWAAPLKATKVESELGKYLGFHIYRFEKKLAKDEVLVVREITETQGKVSEFEYFAVGSNVRVEYEIVLLDSGAFHPSLRNTYMLRYANHDSFIEKVRLSELGEEADGSVYFIFSGIADNEKSRHLKWLGSIENYSDVVKRWPGLSKPQAKAWYSSRRIVENK